MPASLPAAVIAPILFSFNSLFSFTSPGQLLGSQPAVEAQGDKSVGGLQLSRKSLLAALSAACMSSPLSIQHSAALETPRITKRVMLEIAIGSDTPQQLIIGLYGDAAPESVKLFCAMCSESLAPGLTYRGSIASRVEKDRILIMGRPTGGSAQVMERSLDSTGYIRTTLVNRADQYTNKDDNSLCHNRAGLVSMRRGGGDFEFALVPAPNPTLDKERIVVGEVVEGLDFLSHLNQVCIESCCVFAAYAVHAWPAG
eukprot:33814-Pleurochrysis_carterae.AAC.3